MQPVMKDLPAHLGGERQDPRAQHDVSLREYDCRSSDNGGSGDGTSVVPPGPQETLTGVRAFSILTLLIRFFSTSTTVRR
jgi:hypothetical protein